MRNCLPRKTINLYAVVAVCLLIQVAALAQQKPIFSRDNPFQKFADTSSHLYSKENPYYIIAWDKALPGNFQLIRKLDEKTAIVAISSQQQLKGLQQETRIIAANHLWKFSPTGGKELENNKTGLQTWIITGHHTDSLLYALQKKYSALSILSINRPSNTVVIKSTSKFVKDSLASLKEIIFIDWRAAPHSEIGIIGYNRGFHGLSAIDYTIPGANGKNIVAGVKEQQMEEADLDLYKRVLASPIAAANKENHATVIASIIGGAGNSFYDGRGIAYGCKFFPSSFENLFADDTAILNANKVSVQNHSYGTIIQQFYGAEALSYDALSWQNKYYLAVFSAGNQGSANASEGKYADIPGFANLTGNFKMAKNVITVGAIDNKGNISVESSAGPLYDGRMAPQLIALGPNGTSDAAAIVSGTIAVMQQVYADSNNQVLPPASLVKAILYNSAEDVYARGIDYKTGFGLLDSYASIKSLQQKHYDGDALAQGEIWTKMISVPANAAQVKITLAWTDSAAMVNNDKALINDLDLELTGPGLGAVYKPWVLNTGAHPDSLKMLPSPGRDSLNTAEQVNIHLPAAGNYQIKVRGTVIPGGTMPFHIAWHLDTLHTFHFTSPQHTSDINREEDPNLLIRWKTHLADTSETGNLYISYNEGIGWQLLRSSYKLNTNLYQWAIKDTNSTAILKMETGFGEFFSKPFIISKPIRPVVDFVCTDSFSLSWNKHVFAESYKVFALTDSPYLKHILTVTDTFSVMKRSAFPNLVYAVEPVLSNQLPAARSLAFDITLQGVDCFYKTFYYDLQDMNTLELRLELSAASYVDSVYYEQVTATGQVLQTAGSLNVNGPGNIYKQVINDPPGGTTYWRARIKLKSGVIVYSEIISVLTSGKRWIVFYPNPAARNTPLSYVMQQGIPPGSRLQLFDISGRLVKSFTEIPGPVDIAVLAPGMIIYRLISSNGKQLETGKLIIH